jgi:V/A-type H+/Na+-transporting ATPase subunit I
MLRSERLASASIICVKKDVELALEALSSFGEFHIEQEGNANPIEYKKSIQQAEQTLSHLNELEIKLQTEKPRFTDSFKTVVPTKTEISAENWHELLQTTSQQVQTLKDQVDQYMGLLTDLQEETAVFSHLKGMLTIMDSMGVDLSAIEELKLVHVEVASVPHKHVEGLEVALVGFPLILNHCFLTKEADFVCLAMPAKVREDVEKILKIHHAEIFEIPEDIPHDVKDALKDVNEQLTENAQKEKTLQFEFRKLGHENKQNLASWRETTQNILALLRAEEKILQSERLATVKGFVPQKKLPELTEKVQTALHGKALVLENLVAKADDPPTKFKHNRFVAPYEEITKLYGVPFYDELDPTPILAFTFPLIFGLMFGDMGHGLLLLVGGLTVGFLIKGSQSIRNVCWILASCGLGAILAGAVFGEFFGLKVYTPLFNPFTDVLTFLIFSLFVGVAQIVSGFVLEMANHLLRHDVAEAVLGSLPRIGFYLGSVYLIAVYQLDFAKWFSGPILFALVPFAVLVFGKPLVSAVQRLYVPRMEANGEEGGFVQRVFESGDLVTRLLSNTISYSRILALLMAHWALIMVVYSIVGLVGAANPLTLILSGVIVVFGNLFVLALEGLIVFIHTMRLHFYEWFSKFYLGTGTPFEPFKQNFHYTKVTFKKTDKSPESQSP